MGEMAEYYRDFDAEWLDDHGHEMFNGEDYRDIWTKYQKGKLYWTTREGQAILIKDLKQSHIENIIKMISKKKDNSAVDEWLDVFNFELNNRKNIQDNPCFD